MLFFRVVAKVGIQEFFNKNWYHVDADTIEQHYNWLKEVYPDAKFYVELKEIEVTEFDMKAEYVNEGEFRIR